MNAFTGGDNLCFVIARWNSVRGSSAGVYHNCDDLNRSEVVSLRLMTVLELKIVFWSWFAGNQIVMCSWSIDDADVGAEDAVLLEKSKADRHEDDDAAAAR
eukprot:scaffold2079_cov142-Skeletonema_marinoi.AAC.11